MRKIIIHTKNSPLPINILNNRTFKIFLKPEKAI